GVPPPDVIFLDPMFPERRKSGLVKKKFQLIHYLERPCENEADMFWAAFDLSPRKIAVKRPVKGAFLAGVKPSYSLPGKAVRYDVYLPDSMKRPKFFENFVGKH
ncbi:MAG: class I SAM-dependent methyltransferase, partial [Clostridia bacterium]|nr:class I SAM-dependent methyltransferase [Clostridia bacterium]